MNTKEIGHRIRERRMFLKIKQEDLAEISGISERTLRDIEKGDSNPELKSLLRLSEVLGMSISIDVIR